MQTFEIYLADWDGTYSGIKTATKIQAGEIRLFQAIPASSSGMTGASFKLRYIILGTATTLAVIRHGVQTVYTLGRVHRERFKLCAMIEATVFFSVAARF